MTATVTRIEFAPGHENGTADSLADALRSSVRTLRFCAEALDGEGLHATAAAVRQQTGTLEAILIVATGEGA